MASSTVSISTSKTPGSSKSFGGFYLDTTDLKDLAKRLRAVNPALAKVLRVRLRAIGQVVADQAKENANWSTRIPGTIKVGVNGMSVKLTAGGDAAPHGPAYEHNGQAGTFRHPRWGHVDQSWVEQQARPFLGPAADQKADEIEAMALEAIDDTLKEAGIS